MLGLTSSESFECDGAGDGCMGIGLEEFDSEEIADFPEATDLIDGQGEVGDSAAIIVDNLFDIVK